MIFAIYIVFIGYGFSFYWKHDVFFDLLRFHTLFTLISVVIFTISIVFFTIEYTIFHACMGLIGIMGAIFLLSYTKKENTIFLTSFLLTVFMTVYLVLLVFIPHIALPTLFIVISLLGVLIFEYISKIKIFLPYTSFFQYFSLFIILISLPFVYFFTFTTLQASLIFLLIGVTLFFLSIHIRYTNYIAVSYTHLDVYKRQLLR